MTSQRPRRSRREQTTRRAYALLACALLAYAGFFGLARAAHAQVIAGTSVYVRTDSDRTTVIAPRLHVGAPIADTTRVDLVYTADVWTSASVDIRTSASKLSTDLYSKDGYRKVIEQRDEINATVTQEWNDFSLSGTYRYSHEYDYVSHGGIVSGSYSFAEKSATLDVRLAATFDDAGRAGDPNFNRSVTNLGARVGLTQLLDTQTFVQGIYELMSASGFNSSAYRYIALGTNDGRCSQTPAQVQAGQAYAAYCPAEHNPSERLRHAFGLNFRRALGDQTSFGLGYRFYLDSWEVMSHTGMADFSFSPDPAWTLALRYRFYMQGAAKFYKRSFEGSDIGLKYYTNDKELSQFMSHRIALDIEKVFELDDAGHELNVVLSFAPSRFFYANFAPLKEITAYEATLATVFRL